MYRRQVSLQNCSTYDKQKIKNPTDMKAVTLQIELPGLVI
jgi:hypothetical protein